MGANKMNYFSGKVIAITGAGSGIGRSLAIQLSKLGADLALSDINDTKLQGTYTLLDKSKSNNVSITICDVSKKEEVSLWSKKVSINHKYIDILINNAGRTSNVSIEDISITDFKLIFNTVFYSVFYCTKAFLPYLKKRPKAHIVNISSVNAFFPFPLNSPYNSAKSAINSFSQTLQQELRKTRIRVTSIYPGGVKTDIMRNAIYYDPSNRSKVKRFDRIALTSPQKAANIIITAIKKNKKRKLIGIDAIILDILTRIMPQKISDFFGFIYCKLK